MIVIYLLYLGGHSFITTITTLARPQVHKGHCAEWRGGVIKVIGVVGGGGTSKMLPGCP